MNVLDLHEIKRLRGLGWSYPKIGKLFGVCKETVRVSFDPAAKEQQRTRLKRRYGKRRELYRGCATKELNLHLGFGERPSQDILAKRDERLSAPFRDLTGALLGDPRQGQSALDRRVSA